MQDVRKSPEYQRWRREVRQRDENTCRVCGVQHNLHIHHMKPLDKYPELVTELTNGLTLCGNCHTLLNGKEETTNLKQFMESYPYPRNKEIAESLNVKLTEQLKTFNAILSDSLRRMFESNDEWTINHAVDKLLIQLQTYPDSLGDFLDLIECIISNQNFTDKYKRPIVEFLEGHSSWAAKETLYYYKREFDN